MQQSMWQTFFNLGGIAGALSLLWQLYNAIREHFRRQRLSILPLEDGGKLDITMDNPEGEKRRYITVAIRNTGKRYARGCVARAKAIGQSSGTTEIPLHWADTDVRGGTAGYSTVDIAPGNAWRLDVAFSSSSLSQSHLASDGALSGRYYAEAVLEAGTSTIELRVSCEDGNEPRAQIMIEIGNEWYHLKAWSLP